MIYNSVMGTIRKNTPRSDDHEIVTKGYLRGEFKDEFAAEMNEMMDMKLQAVVDILTKEIRSIREGNERFWRKFDDVQDAHNRHEKRLGNLERRVDRLEVA